MNADDYTDSVLGQLMEIAAKTLTNVLKTFSISTMTRASCDVHSIFYRIGVLRQLIDENLFPKMANINYFKKGASQQKKCLVSLGGLYRSHIRIELNHFRAV
jgi:hypothetical protein